MSGTLDSNGASSAPDAAGGKVDVYAPGLRELSRNGRARVILTDDKLPSHMSLIRDLATQSMLDPDTISLARALTSSSFDQVWDQRVNGGRGRMIPAVPYHGRYYRGALDWAAAGALCGHRDRLCEVAQIWNFLNLNVRYGLDVRHRDTYGTMQSTLECGQGDCDDFAIMLAALLGAIGYPVRARVISIDGSSWDHIYPRVGLKNRWITLDMTERGKPMGWEYPRAVRRVDFPLV